MTGPSHIPQILEKMRAIRDAELSHQAKALLFALSTRLNEDLEAWPSLNRLAKDSGLSRSAVKRHLAELKAEGWLNWRPGLGRTSNIYRVFHTLKDQAIQRRLWVQSGPTTDASGSRADPQGVHFDAVVGPERTPKYLRSYPRSNTGDLDLEGQQQELGYGGSQLDSILSTLEELRKGSRHTDWRQLHGRSRKADTDEREVAQA